MTAAWEVYAVRYATRESRRQDMYLRYYVYDEPDGPIQLDYYFWVLRRGDEVVLVDTGIDPLLQRPGRHLLVSPVDALRQLGIGAEDVGRVIVTHCHSDHIGSVSSFPNAAVVVQERELEFWTSPVASRVQFAHTVRPDQIEHLTQVVSDGRGKLLDGDAEISAGLTVRLVGGHTPGHQLVLAESAAGTVVLASDAMHFYEELERDMPFSVLWHVGEVYATYDVLNDLRLSGATLIPGHDAAVMDRFPRTDASEHIVRIA